MYPEEEEHLHPLDLELEVCSVLPSSILQMLSLGPRAVQQGLAGRQGHRPGTSWHSTLKPSRGKAFKVPPIDASPRSSEVGCFWWSRVVLKGRGCLFYPRTTLCPRAGDGPQEGLTGVENQKLIRAFFDFFFGGRSKGARNLSPPVVDLFFFLLKKIRFFVHFSSFC